MAKKVNNENSQDAYVFALVSVARVKLSLSDLDGAGKDLDSAEAVLDTFDSVETVVHAAFYDARASYYQVTPDYFLISGFTNRENSEKWTLPTTIEQLCSISLA